MILKLRQFLELVLPHTIFFFAYVKNKPSPTCVVVLNFVMSCNNLNMYEPFDGSCFEHALSKVC